MKPTPVVRVSPSMGVCFASHHLLPSFASRVRWGCALPATTSSHHLRLAFDGGVVYQPPPPVVRVSRSMGVCCANHHLHPSFASRVRCGCVVPPTTSSCRSRLAFDAGVVCHPPPPPIVRVSRSMRACCPSHHHLLSFASRLRWGCAVPATTSTHRSRLAFDGGVLYQCPAITSTLRSHLAFGEVVPCQPTPPPVFCVSRSMGSHVRRGHLVRGQPPLPTSAARLRKVRVGIRY